MTARVALIEVARQRVGKILREAAMLATERLGQQGRPPLATTTSHTLRRTYISIALLANGFDVKWVMSQVGHANSKMTMDVYAQHEQRVERRHGTAFDQLLRKARGRQQDADRATIGPRAASEGEIEPAASTAEAKKKPASAGLSQVARPRLELGTARGRSARSPGWPEATRGRPLGALSEQLRGSRY
jgi:hypothetical protein